MLKYTEPALCHYNLNPEKSWFVWFDISNGDQTIRKQFRQGINRCKTVKERLQQGNLLVKYWQQKLKQGWNPFEAEPEAMSFRQALEFALKECKVSKATHKAYRLCVKYILSAAGSLANKDVQSLERRHIKQLLSECVKKYSWSNTAYNKQHGYLCSVMGRLVDWEILKFNPAEKIKSLPVTETQKFIPYTEAERKAITEYLYLNHYRFYVYLLCIYYCGLRPKEILSLKIKHIDLINQVISVYPDIELENSKTKKIRSVPINNNLLRFLQELNLAEYNREMYVFGSPYEKGEGNRGSIKGGRTGIFHPDYFKPSYTLIKRDTVTKFWKKIIIDKLGINKHLYAAKHTGANQNILAGISIEALQSMYGHSSKMMTMKYITEIKQIHHREIIEKSISF